jgi:hypothetical protein
MIFGLSFSTIGVILIAAIALVIVLRILSGLLRIGIALAILAFAGYWVYVTFIVKTGMTFLH